MGIGIYKIPVWRGFEQPDELWVCILWKVRYLSYVHHKKKQQRKAHHRGPTFPIEINCTSLSFFKASICNAAATDPGLVTHISKYSSASFHFFKAASAMPPR